jgi:hypothetical protein
MGSTMALELSTRMRIDKMENIGNEKGHKGSHHFLIIRAIFISCFLTLIHY